MSAKTASSRVSPKPSSKPVLANHLWLYRPIRSGVIWKLRMGSSRSETSIFLLLFQAQLLLLDVFFLGEDCLLLCRQLFSLRAESSFSHHYSLSFGKPHSLHRPLRNTRSLRLIALVEPLLQPDLSLFKRYPISSCVVAAVLYEPHLALIIAAACSTHLEGIGISYIPLFSPFPLLLDQL